MTVRAVVNISDESNNIDESQILEVCPALGEEIILTLRLVQGGSRIVSGKVTRLQHHGVSEDSDEKPYVRIWATFV